MPAQVPNWSGVKCKKCPNIGKIYKAMALSRKIVPMAIEISCSAAPMTEATAAIAEPPQIAVPTEINTDVFTGIFNRLPNHCPRNNVIPMPIAANNAPF